MARPRPDLPSRESILALADGEGRLALRVTPGARTEGIALGAGVILVRVRAQPQDGEANEAVLALLADALGLPTSRLRMLRGATGRTKLVQVVGP
ncbi:DUF167 domain-containing protein [Altererythrobacter sp. H2]|uniref:DUF167 domain-containing protein n=1 Tax=Altererythrobacter sp. H2 TaxID=3108391 RepID=UPI000BD89B27|nr:DUF167 domain-containing protein [Altererythrobacter sp. H2]OZA94620.1 MAG: hypothetical protein B7X57_00850 [Erythrobacter sp. 34-65-8]WRK96025.1 DUF167 domain-containing protein [Altererythrobacter sp. H2]